jgi:hypothetical protein
MAVNLRNKIIKNVGTVPQTILTTGPTDNVTVIGLSLTNLINSFVYVDILLKDDSSVEGFYLKETLVAANTSLRAVNQGEKLVMAPNNELIVVSNRDDSIDVVCSFAEIV